MAASESIRWDLTADDRASRQFRDVGRAAATSSAEMDLAAASLKLWNDTSAKSQKATDTLVKSRLDAAKATNTLAKAESFISSEADKATTILTKNSKASKDASAYLKAIAPSAKDASTGLNLVSNSAGLTTAGWGALIGAGVALSPVIATLGVGLGGLALAALAAGKNSQQLKNELVPLKEQFAGFGQELQPVLVDDFAQAVKLAGTVLRGVEPVAAATGKALAGMIGAVDAEFRSGEWQSFFGFMERTAGPDIKLLTDNFVGLLKVLPPLLTSLQPVATTLLKDTSGLLNLVSATEKAVQAQHDFAQQASNSTGWLGKIAHAAGQAFSELVPGASGVKHVADALGLLGDNGQAAGKGLHATGQEALTSRPPVFDLHKAVDALNASMTTLVGNLLTLQGDNVAWQQSMHAAKKQLDSNTAGLHGNSGAALANKQAVIQSTNAAIQFASEQLTLHGNIKQASSTIQAQIGFLQGLHDKSKFVRDEIHALREEERRLAQQRVRQTISVNASGHFAVYQGASGHAVQYGATGTGAAAGWLVPGHGNSDTVPAMLTPGEAVVPKRLTPAVAPFLKAHGVPGFAGGGLVPDYSGSVGGLWPWIKHNDAATIRLFDQAVVKATLAAIRSARSAASAFMDTGARSGSAGIAQAFARAILPPGWSWPALAALWNRESGWNAYAVNPSSGAYGIPQALGHGHPFNLGDYKAQILWGLRYISGRYGSSQAAWGHEEAFGWYDRGGYLPPGLSLAYNGTGRPEQVIPGGRGGGRATVINLNVQVGHGTHPRAAAREIIDILNQGASAGMTLRKSIIAGYG